MKKHGKKENKLYTNQERKIQGKENPTTSLDLIS